MFFPFFPGRIFYRPPPKTKTSFPMKKDQENATLQMPTLLEVTNKAIQDGYTENFKVVSEGLTSGKEEKFYTPQEISIANFHRFEGYSNTDDNAVVYFIETNDGVKGLLIDAYGAYADAKQSNFIREVEDMHNHIKKNLRK